VDCERASPGEESAMAIKLTVYSDYI